MSSWKRDVSEEIAPDEIFLDSTNLPAFDTTQFEGRIERPIGRRIVYLFGGMFLFIGLALLSKVTILQVVEGKTWSEQSESNRLKHQSVFPARGLIVDRNDVPLAWNVPKEDVDYLERAYLDKGGFAHILGFLHYPKKDDKGVYFRTAYEPATGIELVYNDLLKGKQGIRIIETDALGRVTSENVMERPVDGETVRLSIDARVQEVFYNALKDTANEHGWRGGAGGIIDIETGELIALTSYPEYDPNVLAHGSDNEKIAAYNTDQRTPFLNRAVSGLYTPGSIVKPIDAIGALAEGVVTPSTVIYSSGSIKVPNPFFPGEYTTFNDWKAHGSLDVRQAIAVSSNVYFYEIGGGFQGQKGLGIYRLKKYASLFGFGTTTGIDIPGERGGVYPDPEWKEKIFKGDPWRVGDTYFTAIGQYGVQITPIQAIKEAGLLAGNGTLPTPHVRKDAPFDSVDTTRLTTIPEEYFTVIQEGMRRAVTQGTAVGLNTDAVKIAAKTGTAELGVSKAHVNSWVIGFFPFSKPKYAFAVVMERGVKGNTFGGTYAMRKVIDQMDLETPEYFGKPPRSKENPSSVTDEIATTTTAIGTTTPVDIDETPAPLEPGI